MSAGTAGAGAPVEGVQPHPVSGLALRAVVAVAALATVLVVVVAAGGGGLRPVALVVLGVLVVGTATLPVSPLPTVFCLVAALVVLDASVPLWVVVPVGGLLHAVHVGVAWCAVVPVRGQVERAALLPSARRWVLTQALCLPVAAGSALLAPGALRGTGAQVGAGVAAVALLAAAVVLVRLAAEATRPSS